MRLTLTSRMGLTGAAFPVTMRRLAHPSSTGTVLMPTKGFFGSLFDMSFSSLVATKVIKFVYVITLICLTLLALLLVFAGFRVSTGLGIAFLVIVAPLVWFFYLVYVRLFLEFIIAVFRVMETNVELGALKRQEMGLTTSGHSATTASFNAPGREEPEQPTYRVGDIVNGHRWDGTNWVPVS
jgi:hypothetical protein